MDGDDDDNPRPAPAPAPQGRVIGKVIKSDGGGSIGEKPLLPPPRRAGVLNAEEYEAKTAGKQIIAEAQAKAEEIKAEAHRFKEQVFSEAREAAKAEVQVRQAEELARAKIQAGQILAAAEKEVTELALMVATKIIGRDIERNPEMVLEIVANCTEAARGSKAMVIKVNPEDGKVLRAKNPRFMELVGRSVDISIRDDAEVERGGCIIRTDYGTIDGQIRTQIDMLRTVLTPTEAKKEVK